MPTPDIVAARELEALHVHALHVHALHVHALHVHALHVYACRTDRCSTFEEEMRLAWHPPTAATTMTKPDLYIGARSCAAVRATAQGLPSPSRGLQRTVASAHRRMPSHT